MRFHNFLTGEWVEATEWQAALKVGDYYRIADADYDIYGQIIEATEEEGMFWVEGYSVACPQGEKGMFCVVDATHPLTQEEFERAKQHNWQLSPDEPHDA